MLVHGGPWVRGDEWGWDADVQLLASRGYAVLMGLVRITQPLLLAYGGVDRRVPIYHGRKLHEAVRKTNRAVEWVEYEDEAHGWSLVGTRLDFWGRVERFLQRHIGSAPGAISTP